MKKCVLFLLALSFLTITNSLPAQGTAFTYQGRLQNNGNPANGNYDFTFTLFNNSNSTGQVGGTLTDTNVGVTNGLFTVQLDFGSVFAGNATWLAIAVRTNGGAGFTALNPLQELTPTPYAIFARGASAAGLSGTIAANNIANGIITSNLLAVGAVGSNQIASGIGLWSKSGNNIYYNGGNVGIGTNAPGVPLTVDAGLNGINTFLNGSSTVGTWLTLGNTGGGAQWNFISTGSGNGEGASNLVIHPGVTLGSVNTSAALQFQPDGKFGIDTRNLTSTLTVNGSGSFSGPLTVSGAGTFSNSLTVNGTLVAGYSGNSNASGAQNSTIAGGGTAGFPNTIQSSSSFIGAGNANTISSNLNNSFIGAGYDNTVASLGSFLGSGNFNGIHSNSPFAFIGGGFGNSIAANAQSATISGGSGNQAGGNYSTVPGGAANFAGGQFSFAAGYNAQAPNDGSFVWADSQGPAFSSTASNQFLIRAQNGVGINTTTPAATLDVAGSINASGTISGNGSGLTNLNAANLTSGTIPPAQLPSTVALLGADQTFTGQNSFAGILARGGPPGPGGANNNGYAFSGNGGDNDSGMFSSADGQIEFYNNAIEAMRITNGFAGIGTTSPIARLTVDVGNGGGFSDPAAIFEVENCGADCGQPVWTEAARLWNANGNGRVGLGFLCGTSGNLTNSPNVYIGTGDYGSQSDFRIATGNGTGLTDRLYISDSTGAVGIGTTTPAATLDVAGNINASGTISGNGSGLTSLNAANLTGALPALSGASLTTLDASQLTSGTIPQAQLPPTVSLLNANQTFTGQNNFAGILARGGPPGPGGANNNGYAFSGNGGDNDSGMFSSADGQIEFYNNANEVMRIVNGSVGIGTTNPTSPLYISNANVNGAALTLNSGGFFSLIQQKSYNAPDHGLQFWNQSATSTDQAFIFLNAQAAPLLTMLANGNVGIGTTTPGAQFSLGSSLANTKLALFDSGSTFFGLGIQAGQFRLHTSSANDRFSFLTSPNGVENMTILGNGNVGIGMTAPGENLSIATPASSILSATLSLAAGNAHKWLLQSVANNSGGPVGAMQFVDTSTSVTNMTLAPSGNVGIGTATPSGLLEVAGTSRFDGNVGIGRSTSTVPLDIRSYNDGTAQTIRIEDPADSGFWNIGIDPNGDALVFSFSNRFPLGLNYAYLSPSSAGLITTSDRRAKKDIAAMGPCLDRVMALKPSTFRYKTSDEGTPVNYGFIAQDIEEQFPDLVLERNGLKTLVGDGITAINTRAIQDLNRKLEAEAKAKDEEIGALQQSVAELKQLVQSLAARK